MSQTIHLQSDFRDYYDHWFAGSWEKSGIVFDRRTTSGLLRPAMLTQLESIGLQVPRHGRVKDIYCALANDAPVNDSDVVQEYIKHLCEVVVYTDPSAHQGDGKIKISLLEAITNYPEYYASEHIPALPNGLGQSLRYLRIGSRQFWLRYTSLDDWRSNCGDVHIELLCEEKPKTIIESHPNIIQHPLFAVDFVQSNKLYAIDFNISPSIKGTGIEDIMTAKEAYTEIEKWLFIHHSGK